MATSLISQANQLRQMIEQSKQACFKAKQTQLTALKEQMDKERTEVCVLLVKDIFLSSQALVSLYGRL